MSIKEDIKHCIQKNQNPDSLIVQLNPQKLLAVAKYNFLQNDNSFSG